MMARRTSFGDFSEGSGRRQCVAIVKRTGERCRKDAVQGAERCASHRGKAHALIRARARGEEVIPVTPGATARRLLAALALDPPEGAEGITSERGLVDLGRKILAVTGKLKDS